MNVCLVTSRQAGNQELRGQVMRASATGYRIVVLFLQPQRRRLWIEGSVVYCAPGSGVFTEPLETRVKTGLERLRSAWLPALRSRTGSLGRAVLRAERLTFRGLLFGGTRAAGALEAGLSAVARIGRPDPFDALPLGMRSYGAVVALEPACDAPARAAAFHAEAPFVEAGTPNLEVALEASVLHWLGR